MRLYRRGAAGNGMVEVVSRRAEAESDVQRLVEQNMQTVLGVRFLASEYRTGPAHGGRIDSLGLDGNGSPVVVEYKRDRDPGVINQGIFYLSWLMDHRVEFEQLVRSRVGEKAVAQVLWGNPRLICIANDFTRYDVHAVREHRRSIELVRYRLFGADLLGLERVASSGSGLQSTRQHRRGAVAPSKPGPGSAAMVQLARAVDETLLGLGRVNRVDHKTYRAYQRLSNFACLCPPRRSKLLVYLSLDPKDVDLVPGFLRDVSRLGHHGTGDLEVQLRDQADLDRAKQYFRASYAKA
ncbi:transporter [Streptomyces sp. P38-E01]|uniref:Transporter n=1 Tax=Streptomyces tardus TaxID=2780544 RepID=A0A949JMF9_9ACTN|nr:transporter [Streptomyces tardus]MBU7598869.1 transporter [Streptomyces tardus]